MLTMQYTIYSQSSQSHSC